MRDSFAARGNRLAISEETFRRIVKELERFDLSKAGDDTPADETAGEIQTLEYLH